MTSVLLHDLRLSLGASGGYRPSGWHPKLGLTLIGPTPSSAELVWSVSRPDGSAWFTHRVSAPVLDARAYASLELERSGEDDDLDEPGSVAFTLRLVSELDGVDELLHSGHLTVRALLGDHRYAVDNDWLLRQAWLCLDTVDEPDAPRFRAGLFVGGDVQAWQLEAHLFVDGSRIAQATSVEGVHTFTANDGSPTGQSVVATFDAVRGWNNLAASGWGGDWHLLDARDGHYEVKLVREARVSRLVPFDVSAGRLVAPGGVQTDPWFGAVLPVVATVVGDLDGGSTEAAAPESGAAGATAASPAVGDAVMSLTSPISIDDVYAQRSPDHTPAPAALDDDTLLAVQAYVDRAERLLLTWEAELAVPPPHDFGQVLAAEAVQRERPGYEHLAAEIDALADDHPVSLSGDSTTLGSLRTRTIALFTAADARVTSSQQSELDALAPYRALLGGDKLAVFNDHPADAFVYTTTDRRIIQTPDELAAADFWFFEGPLDIRSSAHVEGVEITGSTQGWRVLGYHFAPDGTALAHFEHQGLGPSAPTSAFRPPA